MANWKIIPNFPNYQVSDDGDVKITKKDRLSSVRVSGRGYKVVSLTGSEGCKARAVHRLVAETFGLDVSGLIDHINGNKLDNRLVNLRPCDNHQNLCWARKSDPDMRGIYKIRNSWGARAYLGGGKPTFIGNYQTVAEAVAARDAYEKASALASREVGEIISAEEIKSMAHTWAISRKDNHYPSAYHSYKQAIYDFAPSLGIKIEGKLLSDNRDATPSTAQESQYFNTQYIGTVHEPDGDIAYGVTRGVSKPSTEQEGK